LTLGINERSIKDKVTETVTIDLDSVKPVNTHIMKRQIPT
jgi:hypothetical protein